MAGFLDELIPGFVGRQRYVEEQHRKEDADSREMEGKIYESLLGSSDPHIQSMALSGLFESAMPGKKAKGLKGFLGEREKSPLYQQLRQYISTPVPEYSSTPGARAPETPIERSLPGKVEGPIGTPQATVATPPPATGAAGMPTTSAVTGGPPPITTGSQSAVTPPGLQGPPSPAFVSGTHPRQVFDTMEEATRKKYTAEALGKQEGDRVAWLNAGGTDAEWRQMEQDKARRSARGGGAPFQSIQGEVTNADGSVELRWGNFNKFNGGYEDPETGRPIPGFRPKSAQANQTYGVDNESLSQAVYHKPYGRISQRQQQHVLALGQQKKGQMTLKDALVASGRMFPNASADVQIEFADKLMAGSAMDPLTDEATAPGAAPPVPAVPGAPPAAPTGAVPPPAPTGATPTAAPAAAATPQAATPATPTAPPAVAGGQTAAAKLGASLPPGMGAQTKESGKPPPPTVVNAYSRAKAVNATIDQALAALEPYKSDFTLEGALKLASNYRLGTGTENSAETLAAQLPDLAGLQASAATQLGGQGRSQRQYLDKRLHTPRVPSGRQAILAGHGQSGIGKAAGGLFGMLPGSTAANVQEASQLREGDAGGFDSLGIQYQKLQGAKAANGAFLADMEQAYPGLSQPALGVPPVMAPSHGAAAPPAPTAPPAQTSPTGASTAYKDAAGVWHIKQ